MTNKFIFVYFIDDKMLDPQIGMFADLGMQKNVEFLPVFKRYTNAVMRFLIKIIFSRKLNMIFKNPLKKYFYTFDKFKINKTKNIYFIIPTMSLTKIDIDYLKKIKKENENAKLVLLILDSLNASSMHLKCLDNKIYDKVWDLILTFDENDAQKYKFHYLGYSYYSSFYEIEASDKISDIYYIGLLKGNREPLIASIYDECKKNGLKPNINIVSQIRKKINNSNLTTITKHKTYPEVISAIKSTNCILEVLQEGQESQSIRYFEAVVYNKKLLSNNPNLEKLPFYDERYMKYFEKVEDIDWEWIAKREDIDYKYDNEFSPIHMLEQIEKYFERK